MYNFLVHIAARSFFSIILGDASMPVWRCYRVCDKSWFADGVYVKWFATFRSATKCCDEAEACRAKLVLFSNFDTWQVYSA